MKRKKVIAPINTVIDKLEKTLPVVGDHALTLRMSFWFDLVGVKFSKNTSKEFVQLESSMRHRFSQSVNFYLLD